MHEAHAEYTRQIWADADDRVRLQVELQRQREMTTRELFKVQMNQVRGEAERDRLQAELERNETHLRQQRDQAERDRAEAERRLEQQQVLADERQRGALLELKLQYATAAHPSTASTPRCTSPPHGQKHTQLHHTYRGALATSPTGAALDDSS